MPPSDKPESLRWLPYKDLYGPISSVTTFGTTLVLLHDRRAVVDLLQHASDKTSGRPMMTFAHKLCSYELAIVNQGYDDRLRRCRGMIHRELGTKATAARFQEVQEIEVRRQLVRALKEPDKWLQLFKKTTAATVLKMVYGYSVGPDDSDVLADLQDEVMNRFSRAAAPGAWLVDMMPVLQYLPESFPGIPFKFVQRQMAGPGGYRPSYVSKLLEQSEELSPEEEDAIIWTATSFYGAALETTTTIMNVFTLAMVLNPEVQRRAQLEIDQVVGSSRLPGFDDRDKLPYVGALIKEILRWWPVLHTGFPHVATEDIEYNSIHIPKGAILLPCVWWFMHDPDVYSNPDAFDPERFLDPRNERDPTADTFGYGRRICPGRFFEDASLYINIVRCLAVFKLSKAVDEDGQEVDVEVKMKPGFICHPGEFGFRVTPRSVQHEILIRQVEQELPAETSDAAKL
ncbi:OrdA protein [Xylariaceae sp. FL0255]|nr:OrdA protein [Xylariaceae sp. FL0255]